MSPDRILLQRWRHDAIRYVRENFHVEPDAWQREVLQLVVKPETQRLAMKACKGPGKTCVLAWIILWFLTTRPQAKVACTSITGDNLKDNLWAELALWMGKSAFVTASFTWTASRIVSKTHPETWFAAARSWPKSADAQKQSDTLAGFHGNYVLFVLDESGGIPQAVMTTAEAVLASGIETKVIQAGNPTHLEGPLYRACTIDRHLWALVTITGDPLSPKRSPRISMKWANEQIASYGRDNPWVIVNVLGEFPPSSINSLLGVEEVNAAMERHLREDEYDWAQKRLGVDVARFGDDRTVIFPRQGMAAYKPIVMRNARTNEIAAKVMVCKQRWGAELILVDDTGHWGHGVIDQLVTVGAGAIGINYAGKALNVRYKNRRAEMWITGAEAIRHGAALPNLPEMVAELTVPTYTFVNGVFQLEEKDQIKERLGRSPDLADAYMQTYAMPEMPNEVMSRLRGRQTTRHDGDPFQQGGVAKDGDPWQS